MLRHRSAARIWSIEPAKRALAIDPKSPVAYVILARAQFGTGRLDEALATCHQAIVQKVDGTEIHGFLFQIAFARHDRTALNEQVAWAKGTPSEPYLNLQQMLMAFSQGQPAALCGTIRTTDGWLSKAWHGGAGEPNARRPPAA